MPIPDNLSQYRTFYYVAKYNGISRAARELGISQPAVTSSIKALEQQLDCSLLVRGARGSMLTQEGSLLFNELQPAFDHIHSALEQLRQAKELQTGFVRIGFDGLVSSLILKEPTAAFQTAFPGIKVLLSKIYLPEILDCLDRGMINCAVLCTIQSPFEGSELFQEQIKSSHFQRFLLTTLVDDFIVGPKYSELSEKYIPINRLANIPFIHPTIEVQNADYYANIFNRISRHTVPELPISGALSRLSLVRYNHGFTYFPSLFLAKDYQEKKLFPVFTDIRMRQYDLCVMVKAEKRMEPALECYLELITRHFQ